MRWNEGWRREEWERHLSGQFAARERTGNFAWSVGAGVFALYLFTLLFFTVPRDTAAEEWLGAILWIVMPVDLIATYLFAVLAFRAREADKQLGADIAEARLAGFVVLLGNAGVAVGDPSIGGDKTC